MKAFTAIKSDPMLIPAHNEASLQGNYSGAQDVNQHVAARPPSTREDPVIEVLHGIPVIDPYRWLEDQGSSMTRRWLEGQRIYARAYLDSLPNREQIRKRVEELLTTEVVSSPWKIGARYFYTKRLARSQQPAIMMRESATGEEVVLVDPSDGDATGTIAVRPLVISPDGSFMAYSVRRGGEDFYTVQFLDIKERRLLKDSLSRGFCRGLEFTTTSTGFFYSHEPAGTVSSGYRAIFYHAFGTDPREDIETFFGGNDPRLRLILLSSPSGRRRGYCKVLKSDPNRTDFFVEETALSGPPRLIVNQIEGLFVPFLLDDQIFALTNLRAPNSRFVSINLDCPEPDAWREVIPESESRIQSIVIAGNSLLVTSVKDLAAQIEVFDFSGKSLGMVPLPSKGTVKVFPCRPESDTVFYQFSSFEYPPAILRYLPRTREQDVWASTSSPAVPIQIEIEQATYTSKDGTVVPISLVGRKGRNQTSPCPTFLTAYGGFGACITPQFSAFATFLTERGCLFAVANVRGGAEFGETWHFAAKRHKRQMAIDDFIAAAEWLCTTGRSSPNRLAIGGGSNAGLLVGAALTQRPELFRAVVCLGPLLDMLRYHRFDFADTWIDEYGCADIESDFHALWAYSPYHRVQHGTEYPAVMLISGDADTRCNPMHTRKMTARLQAATSSGRAVLLDYGPTWGHMAVQPLSNKIDALTDRFAFLCHELGLAS